MIQLCRGQGSLGGGEACRSLGDGGTEGHIVELEEGLACTDALPLGDEDLGDEARDLGANLRIILASDDGRITIVGGEGSGGEGAHG